MDIGRVGIWSFSLQQHPAAREQEAAAELEELGYGAVWVPEARGKEALSHASLLLAGTRRIAVATGIASIWARDPVTMAQGHKTLSEAYPGRFLLGMGVSHAPMVEGIRGHRYEKPLARMKSYLDAMDKAPYSGPAPAEEPVRVLAALGPKMLRVSAERADGAHPYFAPLEHTSDARKILGEGPILAPEQAVVLEKDPDRARAIARTHMKGYLALPNYANNVKRYGFSDNDLGGGGSDRLVDAIVAWGDLDAIVGRVRAIAVQHG
ncbi:MAG: TIGR03620 family F420-dependent LLM class oxidoreductase, partial [Dehalococcoidia bacterium]|nr:TIGR03620 family F420-dependent LLM class oxidoreductase [Dehalococcoidia bacterium]